RLRRPWPQASVRGCRALARTASAGGGSRDAIGCPSPSEHWPAWLDAVPARALMVLPLAARPVPALRAEGCGQLTTVHRYLQGPGGGSSRLALPSELSVWIDSTIRLRTGVSTRRRNTIRKSSPHRPEVSIGLVQCRVLGISRPGTASTRFQMYVPVY